MRFERVESVGPQNHTAAAPADENVDNTPGDLLASIRREFDRRLQTTTLERFRVLDDDGGRVIVPVPVDARVTLPRRISPTTTGHIRGHVVLSANSEPCRAMIATLERIARDVADAHTPGVPVVLVRRVRQGGVVVEGRFAVAVDNFDAAVPVDTTAPMCLLLEAVHVLRDTTPPAHTEVTFKFRVVNVEHDQD